MDTITLKDVEVWTRIGVTDDERRSAQRLLVTIVLQKDLKRAGEVDDLAQSINYEDVRARLHELAAKERRTIEAFAFDIAKHALAHFKPESVAVEVKKFVFSEAAYVSAHITLP